MRVFIDKSPRKGPAQILIFFASIAVLLGFAACESSVKKSYNENGFLISKLSYDENEKLHGICYWYFDDGTPQLEATYIHGALNGKHTRYHENGKMQEISFYKNNKADSISELYNLNGDLVIRQNYLNDSLHGSFQRWYDNGTLAIEGFYSHGMMHSSWLFYDQSGSIIGKADFVKGNGIQKFWHSNGQLQREIHYQKNLKHGPETFFFPDGTVEKRINYNHGIQEAEVFQPK